jgi:hypothetical protein
VKERGNEWKKERFTISASLCGGGDLLKALGSVAHYLADGIFYSTNDNKVDGCLGHKVLDQEGVSTSKAERCTLRG